MMQVLELQQKGDVLNRQLAQAQEELQAALAASRVGGRYRHLLRYKGTLGSTRGAAWQPDVKHARREAHECLL